VTRLQPAAYVEQLLGELEQIRQRLVSVLERSQIEDQRLPSNFIGFPRFGWAASDDALQTDRMALLGTVRDFRTRFELLFPHPTPEVRERHGDAMDHVERWLDRGEGDHSIPQIISAAVDKMNASVDVLVAAKALLPLDAFATRLVVDTNVLLDNPDLAQFVPQLGARYMAHLLPVVLREIDDKKRGGRTESLREAAKKADRRLKGLRDNGNVSVGVKVAGDVWAVFEHIEPRADGLPSWLELDVPDDRFIASTLLLQSDHPGSMVVAATSDLNLQTKLAAVRLPFIEPA
jgi:PIN domain